MSKLQISCLSCILTWTLAGCYGPTTYPPSPMDDPPHGFIAVTGGIQRFPLKKSDDCPSAPKSPTPNELTSSESFSLAFSVGSTGDGSDTLKIEADGKATYTYRMWDIPQTQEHEWRQVEFQLSADELTEIKQSIVSLELTSLHDSYYGSVEDGMQIAIHFSAGNGEKNIYCYNHFPPPVVDLYKTLCKAVFVPHRKTIESADKIDPKDSMYSVGEIITPCKEWNPSK